MPARKTKDDTLARVRNNQRRCRARKLEYVAELERKLQECQSVEARRSIETYQGITQRLTAENEKLKELLLQAGVSRTCIEAHVGNNHVEIIPKDFDTPSATGRQDISNIDVSSSPNILDTTVESIEALPHSVRTVSLSEGTNTLPIYDDLLNTPFLDLFEDLPLFDLPQSIPVVGLPMELQVSDHTSQADTHESVICTPLLPACSPDPSIRYLPPRSVTLGDLARVETTQKECDTTLCSLAYDMIRQNDKKGVDMIEIAIILWNGFVKGSRVDEGCRVDNKLLHNVLDYIRNQ